MADISKLFAGPMCSITQDSGTQKPTTPESTTPALQVPVLAATPKTNDAFASASQSHWVDNLPQVEQTLPARTVLGFAHDTVLGLAESVQNNAHKIPIVPGADLYATGVETAQQLNEYRNSARKPAPGQHHPSTPPKKKFQRKANNNFLPCGMVLWSL